MKIKFTQMKLSTLAMSEQRWVTLESFVDFRKDCAEGSSFGINEIFMSKQLGIRSYMSVKFLDSHTSRKNFC